MLTNQFTLLGRVGWIDMRYSEKGVGVTTINLGVKKTKSLGIIFLLNFSTLKKMNLLTKL